MEDWKAIIGSNIKRLRQIKGLTQEQLAVDSDIDLTYAGAIELAKKNPSLEILIRIAKALDVDLLELFERH